MTTEAQWVDPEPVDEGAVTMQTLLDRLVDQVRAINGTEPFRYDLGCGLHPATGFQGVDKFALMAGDQPNIVADLFTDDGWNFLADNSVDIFFSSHFVEHVFDWDHFFTQVYRKMKAGGYFVITTPYYLSVRATQDPDHKQMISQERYHYLMRDWRSSQGLEHYEADVDFEICAFYPVWNAAFAHIGAAADKNPAAADYAMRHIPNAVDDLTVVLRAKK